MALYGIVQLITNQILRALPPGDLDAILPHLERVPLQVRTVLIEADQPVPYVYFIEHGLASVIAHPHTDNPIEVGIIGHEGLAGLPVALQVDRSPLQVFMQVAGSGLRMTTTAFRQAMTDSEPLRNAMALYTHSFVLQAAGTAHANGRHTLDERLARWLLMAHDRLTSHEIPITHEFLSLMLGVRRAGVTNALHVLEGAKVIKGRRGGITIIDRPELEKIAGDAYGFYEALPDRQGEQAGGI